MELCSVNTTGELLTFNESIHLRETVILEETPRIRGIILEKCSLSNRDQASFIRKYTQNKVIIEVTTSCPTLLFLSDNFYQSWRASVNGQDEKIYRANYSFRGTPVPSGRSTVVFYANYLQ